MAGFGSLAQGMPAMPVPAFQQQDPMAQGMAMLTAALKQRGGASGGAGAPAGAPPMSLAAPGTQPGMLAGLLGKLMPGQQGMGKPIDPNTGLPMADNVLAGAAGVTPVAPGAPNPGPASNALSGLW